ncbi:host attachment protein [Brucella anthropi]|uniref:host attachment protein n=1 Tax=Brucella anthropi TaxID=529 RepID=UPI00125DFACB|nr:host attachment protein [Brucella anthropi]QFP64516.1 host attachment protein [Brucella anthropi]
MKKKHWVLIADGARALILRLDARKNDEQRNVRVFDITHKRLQEIMSDKPGRSFASQGTRRSALEYSSDPERQQEEHFAEILIKELERRFSEHEFVRLTVIAEPRMLGSLRQRMTPDLKQAVVAEIAKDLTKTPSDDLEAVLEELNIR